MYVRELPYWEIAPSIFRWGEVIPHSFARSALMLARIRSPSRSRNFCPNTCPKVMCNEYSCGNEKNYTVILRNKTERQLNKKQENKVQ